MLPDQYTIRRAVARDAETLSHLICENARVTLDPYYTPLQMHTFIRYYAPEVVREKIGRQAVFCALEGDQVIGTVALDGDLVVGFYTKHTHLGRGIGAMLMRDIEAYARAQGIEVIQLTASPVGAAFYYKQGFEKVDDYIFNYLGVDFEETLMRKHL